MVTIIQPWQRNLSKTASGKPGAVQWSWFPRFSCQQNWLRHAAQLISTKTSMLITKFSILKNGYCQEFVLFEKCLTRAPV
jgi:hypothetical protein